MSRQRQCAYGEPLVPFVSEYPLNAHKVETYVRFPFPYFSQYQ